MKSIALAALGIGTIGLNIEAQALDDPSFELQTAGTAPVAPWLITAGFGHVINPSGAATDTGLPSHGTNWAEVGANGTVAATPPSNPGGVSTPPVGAGGIAQNFTYTTPAPHLTFDAAFILNGALADLGTNDFMSIDVSDGVTSINLYYADSFSSFPNTSIKYGLPMTDVTSAVADLSVLFPSSDSSTIFEIAISIGNGGDGAAPSKGYADNFAFRQTATATARNGSGINSLCFTNITPPALGTTWVTQIDHSAHPGAAITVLLMKASPTSGIISPYGEILVTGAKYLSDPVVSAGTFDTHSIPFPPEVSLAGIPAACQGIILGGAGPELCNAIDFVTGL